MRALPILALAWALLAVACSSGSDVPTSDVVSTIPWQSGESLVYRLQDRSGAEVGKTTLSVQVEGATTRLSQSFVGNPNTDKSQVVADSKTLKPQSATREIVARDSTETLEVTYSENGALIKQGDRQTGISVPEHSYDNDSSLFLWRTIAFAPGYEAAYNTIITNHRSRQKVTLNVVGKEDVSVAGASYNAWKLEIRAGRVKQTAWFADNASRTLLRYDNGAGLTFELESRP